MCLTPFYPATEQRWKRPPVHLTILSMGTFSWQQGSFFEIEKLFFQNTTVLLDKPKSLQWALLRFTYQHCYVNRSICCFSSPFLVLPVWHTWHLESLFLRLVSGVWCRLVEILGLFKVRLQFPKCWSAEFRIYNPLSGVWCRQVEILGLSQVRSIGYLYRSVREQRLGFVIHCLKIPKHCAWGTLGAFTKPPPQTSPASWGPPRSLS